MQDDATIDDLLQLTINLQLSPTVKMKKTGTELTLYTPGAHDSGKVIVHADATLQFAGLTTIINGLLKGKRFDISEGLLARHIVLTELAVSGTSGGTLLVKVDFTGSFSGTLYLAGTPVYNPATQSLVLLNPRHELKTKNFLLKGAQLFFASRIEKELKQRSNIPLQKELDAVRKMMDAYLNQEWRKGMAGEGAVEDLAIREIKVTPGHLLISMSAAAAIELKIDEDLLRLQS